MHTHNVMGLWFGHLMHVHSSHLYATNIQLTCPLLNAPGTTDEDTAGSSERAATACPDPTPPPPPPPAGLAAGGDPLVPPPPPPPAPALGVVPAEGGWSMGATSSGRPDNMSAAVRSALPGTSLVCVNGAEVKKYNCKQQMQWVITMGIMDVCKLLIPCHHTRC